MDRTAFEMLCRQIADVPWVVDNSHWWRASFGADASLQTEDNDALVELKMFTQGGNDYLRITFTDAPSPHQIAAARAFFGALELEYIAHEIAPNAPWEFGENHAGMGGVLIIRRPNLTEPWTIGIGPSWLRASSVDRVISLYREDRREHDAARGVKTRKPKPQRERQTSYYADGTVSIEHARNILRCLAEPERYTLIAEWANENCGASEQVLRRALEVTAL